MANKNRRTKARRIKEVKETKHKKTAEKPIYKRPWVWIVLIAIVAGITIPSVWQWYTQSQEQAALDAVAKEAQQAQETLVADALKDPLAKIGVSDSAIKTTEYAFYTTTEGGFTTSSAVDDSDLALVTIKTDLRTIYAQCAKQPPIDITSTDSAVTDGAATGSGESVWSCSMISNENGDHIYWSYLTASVENATQTAIQDANGQFSMVPMYSYATDQLVPGATTAPAVTSEPDAETTGSAVTTGSAATSPAATSSGAAATSGAGTGSE